jgi:serine/threonine-protein kinase
MSELPAASTADEWADLNLRSVTIDEAARRCFEAAWAKGAPARIEEVLPDERDSRYLATLEELVLIDLEFAWKNHRRIDADSETSTGDRSCTAPPIVEGYLARFPALKERAIALRLLQQEWRVRRRYGDHPAADEYARRFPELAVATTLQRALHGGEETDFDERGAQPVAVGAGDEVTLPRLFGHYELLEQIGRGGMGVVYRARQLAADRIVAVKVVRCDLLRSLAQGTQSAAMERFRHEVQAAARLEHESVVSIYEVGDVDGELFFSMRYVAGRSLFEALRDGPMPCRRAAGYLEPVARAVEEAHRHGILHRDLKPQNILVDAATDRAYVADFGLAKLQEAGEELTRSGEIMGTPPYISPEQARDSAHVTASTDVYALGATLYHLLTGRPPFQAATAVETIRQVLQVEPLPLRKLNPAIDADLETISLKCLEKEPTRRYPSALALADDLQRYLEHQPIRARPLGRLNRVARWCRRNPLVAGLIASTCTFLVAALVSTLVGYQRTTIALRRAEDGYRHARNTVDRFYTRVSEDTLLNQHGMQPLRRELLQQALQYYQQLIRERDQDPALQDELALTYYRVARIKEQIESPDESLVAYRQALERQQRLVQLTPQDVSRRQAMGDTWNAIGGVLARRGDFEDACAAYAQATAIREVVAEASPKSCEPRRVLANTYMNQGLVEKDRGRTASALQHFERAQQLRRQLLNEEPQSTKIRRDQAIGCYNLANLHLSSTPRNLEGAQTEFEEALRWLETLLKEHPHDLDNEYRRAACCRMLGDIHSFRKEYEAATSRYTQGVSQLEKLAARNPDVAEYRAALACIQMNVGQLERDQNRNDAARRRFAAAITLLEELITQCPNVADYRRDWTATQIAQAELAVSDGQLQEARDHLQRAESQVRELLSEFPANSDYLGLLGAVSSLKSQTEPQQPGP